MESKTRELDSITIETYSERCHVCRCKRSHGISEGYALALDIYKESKVFPREEPYSLTDQIRRSSRSVAANLAEAWKRRHYKKAFVSKLIECSAEAAETEVWLDMAFDLGFLEGKDEGRSIVALCGNSEDD